MKILRTIVIVFSFLVIVAGAIALNTQTAPAMTAWCGCVCVCNPYDPDYNPDAGCCPNLVGGCSANSQDCYHCRNWCGYTASN